MVKIKPLTTPPPAPLEPLQLTTREAAEVLRISERTLWGLTAPRGPIRAIKIGTALRYPLEELKRFIALKLEETGQDHHP